MSIGLDQKGIRRIESLLGNFLWGWSDEKKPKTHLIAWEKLHLPKELGGLGWKPLEVKMKSFLAMKIPRIFAGEDIGEKIRVLNEYPVSKIESVILRVNPECRTALVKARRWWRKLQWEKADDFTRRRSLVEDMERELWAHGVFLEEIDRIHLHNILEIFSRLQSTGEIEGTYANWRWTDQEPDIELWMVKRPVLQQLMLTDWIQKRRRQKPQLFRLEAEKTLWKRLWESVAPSRTKMDTWKLMHEGYFTNLRAEKMGVRDALCEWCGVGDESIDHLFWSCRRLRQRKTKLQQLLGPRTDAALGNAITFGEQISEAVKQTRSNLAALVTLISWAQTVWGERNKFVFERKRKSTPLAVILGSGLAEVSSKLAGKMSEGRELIYKESLNRLEVWREQCLGRPQRVAEPVARRVRVDASGSEERNTSVNRARLVTGGHHPGRPPDSY
ncbi:hypothetical protein R1sor_006507 [Riccia sorocarpa]|uniref:Reverse transcriptase zinc-binding domain-containing protein n=1 Tax=Riccia sorocarpa TaxID=122646 RepID=A0ABD3HPV7_9MARC